MFPSEIHRQKSRMNSESKFQNAIFFTTFRSLRRTTSQMATVRTSTHLVPDGEESVYFSVNFSD